MTQDTAGKLSALDIRALREADSACFDFNKGESGIRAIKKLDKPSPWESERTYNVPVSASGITDYAREYSYVNPADSASARCFAMVHSCQFDEHYKTAMSLLRPGDELRFSWVTGNSNEGIKAAGFMMESLDLIVVREHAKGVTRLTFRIFENTVSIGSLGALVRR